MALQLGDPELGSMELGASFDLVIAVHSEGLTAVWHAKPLIVVGSSFPVDSVWTLYGAVLSGRQEGYFVVELLPSTTCIRKPLLKFSGFQHIKEVCAGIGGISLGMQAAGGTVLACLDKCAIACETLRLNNCRVIESDLASRDARTLLHQVQETQGCVLGAGIPCQGYSCQGNGLGYADERSKTLLLVLQSAWHMQVQAVLLECVSEILKYPEALAVIHDFAAKAGYRVQYTTLELAHQWAARRLRWWCLLTPLHLPPVALPNWPIDQACQHVGQVIPH